MDYVIIKKSSQPKLPPSFLRKHLHLILPSSHHPILLPSSEALLPQIVDAVQIPVIATGGLCDARQTAAALLLGASAVQIGTGLLRCPEVRPGGAGFHPRGKPRGAR